MQDCSNTSANALESLQSCATSSYIPHWGRVTHICVSKLTIIGSDNGLAPGRRQATIWTNAGILLICTPRNKLQRNLNQNSCIFIQGNAFEIVVGKMVAILSRPQFDTSHHWCRESTGLSVSPHSYIKIMRKLFSWDFVPIFDAETICAVTNDLTIAI